MYRLAIRSCAASMLVFVGCVGKPAVLGFGDEGAEGGGEGDSGSDDDGFSDTGVGEESEGGVGETGPAPVCDDDSYGVTMRATLSATQYDATVADLTGAAGPFAAGLLDVNAAGPFGTGIGEAAATELAPTVAAAVDLVALLPCDPELTDAQAQQDCFDAFVPGFARAAWRRPVAVGDLDAQIAAFAADGTFDARMRAVIASVLAASEFSVLARSGTPTAGDSALLVLDAHALATRLAMFLWNSGPDEQLLALADSGELLDAAVLHAQAERLLDDSRAARMVDDFHTQWLGLGKLPELEKDPELFPEFGASLGAAMLRGTQLFARQVLLAGSGRLEDLFTQPTSFANDELAAIYGDDIIGAVPASAAFEAVDLDPAHRGGLLTEPSFAAAHSLADRVGFTSRGLVVRENLLCQDVPPPPPNVDTQPEPAAGVSHKELWQQALGEPACMACHIMTDPLGFGLDNYDAIGRWTDEIDDMPVDPSSEGPEFPYADRDELIEQVLGSDLFTPCVVRQYLRYALDRDPNASDACTLASLEQSLVDSDGDVRALLLAIVDADAFRVARVPG